MFENFSHEYFHEDESAESSLSESEMIDDHSLLSNGVLLCRKHKVYNMLNLFITRW